MPNKKNVPAWIEIQMLLECVKLLRAELRELNAIKSSFRGGARKAIGILTDLSKQAY